MSISIDGKLHRGKLKIKYGEEFPKRYQNIEIDHPKYGECLIWITNVGIPKWDNDYSVLVPYEYYITQVIKPNAAYVKEKKKKRIGLQLIKG